jgi:hypothetical protein
VRRTEKIIPDDLLPIAEQLQDELKKLYLWSFAEAAEAQDKYEAINHPTPIDVNNLDSLTREPFRRWVAAQELMTLYESYQEGDRGAILKTLHICFSTHLPIPRWCELAYLNAFRKVKFYNAKTWRAVFGNPHPKGTHIGAKKQEQDMGFRVYDRIKQIKEADPSVAIDGWLFERIGREFGIGGKTLTEEYYYKMKNLLEKK